MTLISFEGNTVIMKKNDFKHRFIQRFFSVFFFSIIFATVFFHIRDLRAETGLPADAVVEKVADLGIIKTAPAIWGRDGGFSALFQNRSIWIFGDTIVSQKDHSAPTLLSNSCSWTIDRDAGDGITGFEFYQDPRGIPLELFPFTPEEHAFNRDHQAENCPIEPCGARWALWPGAIISDSADNRLLLFFKKVLVKPGVLNFQTAGHGMAVWRRLDEAPERIRYDQDEKWPRLMFGENEPAFGSAAIVVHSMVYVFGCSLDGDSKPCRLARVPLANVTDRDAWEFYSASQKWQKEIDGTKVVLDGNDMMSISYNSYLKRYLTVYSQPMSTSVMLRTAKYLEGPWSKPLKAFDAKAPANAIGWIYDALEHPEYAQDNGRMIYITYSRQTGPLTFEMRLVAVTLRKS